MANPVSTLSRLWEMPATARLDKRFREWVYFLRSEVEPNLIKIGKAQDLKWRVITIQYMSPVALNLVGAITGPIGTERVLHARFATYRQHGEWFFPAAPLIAFVSALPKGAPVQRATVEAWAKEAGVDLDQLMLQGSQRRKTGRPKAAALTR